MSHGVDHGVGDGQPGQRRAVVLVTSHGVGDEPRVWLLAMMLAMAQPVGDGPWWL